MPALLDADEVARLEAAVQRALRAGDDSSLSILGYGELSLVLAWPTDRPRVAAKRLPLFEQRSRAEAYGALVEDYLAVLVARGVHPVPSEFATTPVEGGRWAAYVVQPVLEPTGLAPAVLATDPVRGRTLVEEIVVAITSAVDDRVGLDGQLSNWAATPTGLRYLDVTTPMLTDERGATRLDVAVLTSPLPAALRPAVRRFVAPGVTAKYHRPRDVVVDLAANLLKERLGSWVEPTLVAANRRLGPPITRAEVERYYRSDARLWEAMWRLRRADRWWQRTVRRRPYATLLPGKVTR